ncbi:MAG TPA: FAD-dependent oxidoreductase [Gemmatimonadales bacterium]|nr:FAD-dependent oxidoreductase [Gemmatimonadales bacterium]
MSDQGGVIGPDLTKGIPVDQIQDGGMIEGHVGDEPVLLVRRGAVFHAVGARCTHYSGPLAEGLLVGDTVHCPWHHACFDLRTGRATGGPALAPIACYRTERRLDLIVVTGKVTEAPTRPRVNREHHPQAIVIVGAGAAGTAAALTLRDEGSQGKLTLIDSDDGAPYDRPNLSKDYLAGTAPEEWLPIRSHEDLAARDIRLILGSPVLSLGIGDRTVRLADGRAYPYASLLLATGADAVRLPVPGADRPHVATLRSLADSRRLIRQAEGARRAVVLGAGFLGLEVAASLRHRNLEVHVVAPDQRPLGKVLGEELGLRVQRLHEEHGVVFHLGHVAREIGEKEVTLDDGSTIEAELVVIAAGARPRVDLAMKAGLVLARGIQVDRYLETSVKGVYAAGDAARWPDPRTGKLIGVEHWAFAMRQGQAAARNMLGPRTPFAVVPFFWSQHYDMQISYVGHAEAWDRLDIVAGLPPDQWEQHYLSGNTVIAVATVGRDQASLRAEAAMESAERRQTAAV